MMTREEILREVEQTLGFIPGWVKSVPDELLTYEWGLFKDFEIADTRIPLKYKQLIGLGVAAALGCRYSSFFHKEVAKLHGATEEELKEALYIAKHTSGWSAYLNGMQYDYDLFKGEMERSATYLREEMRRRKAA